MNNLGIKQYQQRLDYLFKQTAVFSGDIELQSHWAKYLCVLVSGYLEVSIRLTFSQYAKEKAAPYVANFVEGRLKGFQNPNMEKILQLTRLFNPEWEALLKNVTEGELKDAVDSIVSNRHKIVHGESVTITFSRIKGYYQNAVKVVEIINKQLEN